MRECIAFTLVLLGALGAEDIPFLAVMVLLAGVVTFFPLWELLDTVEYALYQARRRRAAKYYRVCPYCGAHLDPGELCDCQGWKKESRTGRGPTQAA